MTSQIDWTQVQHENKWKILMRQKRFALWAVYSAIGGMMVGYDLGITGNAAALVPFKKQYGEPWPADPSGYVIPANVLSGWSGAANGGDILGIIIAGPLVDWVGRKHSIGCGTLLTAVGIALQAVSHEWVLFLVGRLISAIGFGIVYVTSPVWIGETVRPELRGFFMCLMIGTIVFGQWVLTIIAKVTSTMTGHWSYRTLILSQLAFCVPLSLGYFFFPESPYYCLRHGKPEKARKSLEKIHGSDDQAFISAEIVRLQQNLTFSEDLRKAAHEGGIPLVQCFKKRNYRRTLISLLPPLTQQLSGGPFVLGYVTYFLSLLNIKNYFDVSIALLTIMLVAMMSAFPMVEVVGRRKLLFFGSCGLCLMNLIMGISGCFATRAATWVFLVGIFIWAVIFQATMGAAPYAFSAEIASLPLRPSIVSLMGIVQNVTGWAIGLIIPYLINPDAADLGPKVSFIFFALSFPLCVLMFFYIPETKGLSNEEMDYLFTEKVNCRRFPEVIREKRMSSDVLTVQVNGVTLKAEDTASIDEVEHITTEKVV